MRFAFRQRPDPANLRLVVQRQPNDIELAHEVKRPEAEILDPGVIDAVSPVTGALALPAAYVPARRAARLDSAVALRAG